MRGNNIHIFKYEKLHNHTNDFYRLPDICANRS